jgi:TonB-dependent receptor
VKIFILIISIILAFILSTAAYSQKVYDIKGKVIDSKTGEALQGATVLIEESKQGNITDSEGEFIIKGYKSSALTLKATFVGYESKTIKHDIAKNGNKFFSIELIPEAIEVGEVNVEGEAAGQVKAMLDQKRAINIKNVVSAEQIQQFPDLNAAEAMQRIPGITLQRDQGEGRYIQLRGTPPELTTFNINGEQIPSPEGGVRFVGMDIVSADQIDFIEISKVLTPDMDGDGIGGTVNIITKKAESEIPKINGIFSGGYNNLRGTNNYQLQFSYGQRFNGFGFNVNSSYYKNDQGSDNMEFKFAKGPLWGSQGDSVDNYYVQYREAQLRHYDITRERTGLSATLDYKFSNTSEIYLTGMYNNYVDNETRRRKIYDLDDAITQFYYLYGGIDHEVRQRTKDQTISTLNLGGNHELLGIDLDYEISYANARENQPDRIEALFDNPGQAIAMEFDRSDPDWPKVTYPNPENAQNAFDYDNYEFDNLLFQNIDIRDENLTAKVNFKIPYELNNSNSGYIKFGGKSRFKDKKRDIFADEYGAYFTKSNIYPGEGAPLSLTTVTDGFADNNLLDKGFLIDNMPSAGKMKDFFEYYSQFFIIDRTGTKTKSFGEDYQANENIYATYLMVRHDFDDLMLIGGVRYEKTDIDYQGRKIITYRGNFKDLDTLTDKRSHEFLLPQFQARYSFDNTFNLRGAVTYTYSRPNFEDVLPYREEDREEVKYGNPDLKFPTSLNIDLLAEKYLPDGGIISGGLFYKQIDDFIFYYKRFAHEGEDFSNYGLVEIEKAINGLDAFVLGAEIQSQFKLSFLPSFLSDFGIFFNYTYTYSEAYIYKRLPANYVEAVVIFGEDDLSMFSTTDEQETITLPGQAMHTGNLALYYETEDFYAKISANYHDAFLYQLGADPDLDEFYDEALHMDFTANYKISEYARVFIDVINITNAPLKFYLGTPDNTQQQEYYSWWSRMGVKISI